MLDETNLKGITLLKKIQIDFSVNFKKKTIFDSKF